MRVNSEGCWCRVSDVVSFRGFHFNVLLLVLLCCSDRSTDVFLVFHHDDRNKFCASTVDASGVVAVLPSLSLSVVHGGTCVAAVAIASAVHALHPSLNKYAYFSFADCRLICEQ